MDFEDCFLDGESLGLAVAVVALVEIPGGLLLRWRPLWSFPSIHKSAW